MTGEFLHSRESMKLFPRMQLQEEFLERSSAKELTFIESESSRLKEFFANFYLTFRSTTLCKPTYECAKVSVWMSERKRKGALFKLTGNYFKRALLLSTNKENWSEVLYIYDCRNVNCVWLCILRYTPLTLNIMEIQSKTVCWLFFPSDTQMKKSR